MKIKVTLVSLLSEAVIEIRQMAHVPRKGDLIKFKDGSSWEIHQAIWDFETSIDGLFVFLLPLGESK